MIRTVPIGATGTSIAGAMTTEAAGRSQRMAAIAVALGLSAALLSPTLQLATGSPLPYLLVLVGSGLIALRARWLRSRRLRMGDFNERLMEIAQAARNCSARDKLLEHKNHLMDILGEVVNDLDAERVSQEEFEHFSFTWQAVDALVRDQLLLTGVNIGDSSHG